MTRFYYTDGSCLGNPGPGGYAAVRVRKDEAVNTLTGYEAKTTNNRMEIMGVLAALEDARAHLDTVIYTDSQYVVDGCNKWVDGWARRNWVKADGKPVLNADLWKRVLKLMHAGVAVTKIKGHAGHKWNEHVDVLAKTQAQKAAKSS